MPLTGKSISSDISEFHSGSTYKRTKKKYGKERANKQAIAVAYANKRKKKRKGSRSRSR